MCAALRAMTAWWVPSRSSVCPLHGVGPVSVQDRAGAIDSVQLLLAGAAGSPERMSA